MYDNKRPGIHTNRRTCSKVQRTDTQLQKNDYNQTLARRDFIDPFFRSPGWDIDNAQGYAEAYREVIHEDKIKIGGAT